MHLSESLGGSQQVRRGRPHARLAVQPRRHTHHLHSTHFARPITRSQLDPHCQLGTTRSAVVLRAYGPSQLILNGTYRPQPVQLFPPGPTCQGQQEGNVTLTAPAGQQERNRTLINPVT
ncbi:unnamed protein product [Closterium sp. Yama58-4]|nr:unnamed protein product [Closterium sp. Yama58-4]